MDTDHECCFSHNNVEFCNCNSDVVNADSHDACKTTRVLQQCEREGVLVQLRQECPADDSKRLGETCLCDNECNANGSCSLACTQSIPDTLRPPPVQVIRQDNFCLPQQKRGLEDVCQCDADCQQGLLCFDLGAESRCLIPNGLPCDPV
ncbi:MAG: hypothetical protein MHM6MM_007057 [Cercozoa sp. M6MM]